MRFSNSLNVEPGPGGMQVHCSACRQALGPAGGNWKEGATRRETPARDLDGPYCTGQGLLLRQFCCPGCGALLDTEMALPGEPLLDDRLFAPGA
jgi:acetone carboxylase gamma subunit